MFVIHSLPPRSIATMMGAAGLGANSIPNDNVRGIKVSDGQGLRSVCFPHHQNKRWSFLSSTQMCIFFCSCIGDSLGRSGSASLRFTGRCCIPNVIRQFFTACPETKFFVCVCLTLPFRQAHGLGVYPVWMLVLAPDVLLNSFERRVHQFKDG